MNAVWLRRSGQLDLLLFCGVSYHIVMIFGQVRHRRIWDEASGDFKSV